MRPAANKIILANLKKMKQGCKNHKPFRLPNGRYVCKNCFNEIKKDDILIGESHTGGLSID